MSRPNKITAAARVFDRIIGSFAFIAGVIIIFIVLVVLYEVALRYFFGVAILWVLEVTEYCLLFLTFLATTWLLKRDGHIKMDLLYNRFPQRTQFWISGFSSVLGALIFLTITWYGAKVVWNSYLINYKLASQMEPVAYPLFVIIPFGSLFMVIQFVRAAYGYFRAIKSAGTYNPVKSNDNFGV